MKFSKSGKTPDKKIKVVIFSGCLYYNNAKGELVHKLNLLTGKEFKSSLFKTLEEVAKNLKSTVIYEGDTLEVTF